MGHPGYYLLAIGEDGEPAYDFDGFPVISGPLFELPIQSRIGVEYGVERSDIVLRTERGRRWIYPNYEFGTRKMLFRLTLAQFEDFKALDVAVGGQRDPFIWVVDVTASPPDTIFCRKDSSRIVRQVDGAVHGGIVDYEVNLSGESIGPGITD